MNSWLLEGKFVYFLSLDKSFEKFDLNCSLLNNTCNLFNNYWRNTDYFNM